MKFKGLSLLWCALTALFALPSLAQDHMTATVSPTSNAGEWALELNIENPEEDNLTAFQLDLVLPNGFSVVENSAQGSSRLPDHTVMVNKHPSKVYKVVAYSLNNAAILGNSGCVATLTITVDETVESGTYTAELNNIYISDRKGNEGNFEDTSVSWTYEKKAEEVERYLLTYIVDGEVFQQDSVAYGATLTPPVAPEKEGHTFVGWGEVPPTMPAEDVTLTAQYTVNEYTLTYILDGEVYAEVKVPYGATIVPLEVELDSTREFSGWANLPDVMPANDVTVTGTTILTHISGILSEDAVVDVYSINGKAVATAVSLRWINQHLSFGLYIVNGKKIFLGSPNNN